MTNLNNVKILGTKINTKLEIKEIIRKAHIETFKYHKMLTSINIKLNNKIIIYKIYIRPILLYNCQTWSPSESDLKSLEVFERKFLRKIYRIFYPSRISNENLKKKTNVEDIKELIRKSRWSYLRHILRRLNLPMAIELQNDLSGKKQKRRSRINIATVTKNKMMETGLTGLDEAKTKAQNREEWKN